MAIYQLVHDESPKMKSINIITYQSLSIPTIPLTFLETYLHPLEFCSHRRTQDSRAMQQYTIKWVGNWVDWEDVSTGSYKGDGFEHPNFDDDGEW